MGRSQPSSATTRLTAYCPISQTFNVWYGKWAGGDKYDDFNAKEKSQTRVDIKKDAGYTRADAGSSAYLCLFFARGCCPYG